MDEAEVDSGAQPPGGAFYDSPGVFDRYSAHRGEPIVSPNLVMEEPAVLDHLGDVACLRVLDLGPEAGVDLITARLVLHYLPDVAPVLAACRHRLSPRERHRRRRTPSFLLLAGISP